MEPDFERILAALLAQEVDFVLIGGVAMAAHGVSYVTQDIDIAYARERANVAKLVGALKPFSPKLRVEREPAGVPFPFDVQAILNGGNFTLVTDAGNVDILAFVEGFKTYAEIKGVSLVLELFGRDVAVLSIDGLILAKRAAGRPKDLLAIPQLELLKETESN